MFRLNNNDLEERIKKLERDHHQLVNALVISELIERHTLMGENFFYSDNLKSRHNVIRHKIDLILDHLGMEVVDIPPHRELRKKDK